MFLYETFVFSQKTIHMRHIHFLLAGFLLCICCTLQAKNRVIDQPPFIVRNTTSIEVSKVVISDTATVLHIYAKYRPKYWIQIAPDSYLTDNNGETYQLRSGIGIIPGKEFWMPESGEAEFQLVFPPLSDNATSFDFTEGEKVENGFSIWGIQLKSKKLPELALPQNAVVHKADPNAELPEPVIQYGKAMLKGKLLDSRPNMGMPISIAVWENIKGDITDIPLDIQPDGSFTKEVTLPGTTHVPYIWVESICSSSSWNPARQQKYTSIYAKLPGASLNSTAKGNPMEKWYISTDRWKPWHKS